MRPTLSSFIFTMLSLISLVTPVSAAAKSVRDEKVRREGMFLGMDPGLTQRFDDTGKPLYARLDFRLGGCITRKVHLGGDWRMDQLVTGAPGAFQSRHEIGPVITFFMVDGWFARTFAHIGGFDPFYVTTGGQTGYEFSFGRYGGAGMALGGDMDIPFDGQAPRGYSVSFTFFLTAYNLGSRRGREPMIP